MPPSIQHFVRGQKNHGGSSRPPISDGPTAPPSFFRRGDQVLAAYAVPPLNKFNTLPLDRRSGQVKDPNAGHAGPGELSRITEEESARQLALGDVFDTDVENIDGSSTADSILAQGAAARMRAKGSTRGGDPHMWDGDKESSYADSDDGESIVADRDPTVTISREEMAAARHELAKHPEARMLPPRPNPAGELPSWIPKRDESLRGASAQQEPMAERTQPGRSTGRPLELFGSAAFDRRLAFRGAEHRAPSPDKRHSGVPTEQEKQVGLFEASDIADDDDDESIAPEPESQPRPDPGQPKGTTTTAKAAPTIALDYPPSTLSKMSYATLLAEPFDQPPSISSPVAPSVLPSTHVSAPLDHQLAYVSSLPPDQQRQFFASLSTPQWEDAGDWFAAQFAAHVARKRDARRRKRKVAETFEEELRAREALVRRRREGVEEVLAGMKRGGDAVLKSGGGGGNSAS